MDNLLTGIVDKAISSYVDSTNRSSGAFLNRWA